MVLSFCDCLDTFWCPSNCRYAVTFLLPTLRSVQHKNNLKQMSLDTCSSAVHAMYCATVSGSSRICIVSRASTLCCEIVCVQALKVFEAKRVVLKLTSLSNIYCLMDIHHLSLQHNPRDLHKNVKSVCIIVYKRH